MTGWFINVEQLVERMRRHLIEITMNETEPDALLFIILITLQ
jgi:hypothetical protein